MRSLIAFAVPCLVGAPSGSAVADCRTRDTAGDTPKGRRRTKKRREFRADDQISVYILGVRLFGSRRPGVFRNVIFATPCIHTQVRRHEVRHTESPRGNNTSLLLISIRVIYIYTHTRARRVTRKIIRKKPNAHVQLPINRNAIL